MTIFALLLSRRPCPSIRLSLQKVKRHETVPTNKLVTENQYEEEPIWEI
jgi:hypothetical protein